MLLRTIVVSMDVSLRRRVEKALAGDDVLVESVIGRAGLWQRVTGRAGDVFVLDEKVVPEPLEDALRTVRELPEMPWVVLLATGRSPRRQATLLACGADTVLHAGLGEVALREALASVIERRLRRRRLMPMVERAAPEPSLADFVSDSPAMQGFLAVVRRVVASESALLVLGETGVGKERLARAVHAEGPRSNGPFVAVNCGALPEALLESELFGHEEGAFTGATRSRRGAFELAHGGTLFLDEIAELPLHLQVKLLRALQDFSIRRLGAEQAVEVNVRVMAASNRDIEAEVEAGSFRRDLFYRLNVVSLAIPPLRDRREDIPGLVHSYIDYLGARIGRHVEGIDPDALEAMVNYTWPGNVRELINVVERAMLLCRGDTLTIDDLPVALAGYLRAATSAAGLAVPETPEDVPAAWLEQTLAEVRDPLVEKLERVYLEALLHHTGGRIDHTAGQAGIRPRTLYAKMKQYGLSKEDYRREPS